MATKNKSKESSTEKNKRPALFKISRWTSEDTEEMMILTDIESGGLVEKITADFGDRQEITISLEEEADGPVLTLRSSGMCTGRLAVFPVVSNVIEVRLI